MTTPNETILMRSPDLIASEIDGTVFIANDAEGEIYALDQIASATWRVTDGTTSVGEVISLFASGFPDRKWKTLERLVHRSVDTLLDRGVLLRD